MHRGEILVHTVCFPEGHCQNCGPRKATKYVVEKALSMFAHRDDVTAVMIDVHCTGGAEVITDDSEVCCNPESANGLFLDSSGYPIGEFGMEEGFRWARSLPKELSPLERAYAKHEA